MNTVLLIFTLTFFFYIIWKLTYHRSKSNPLPPGPLNFPIIGALPYIGSLPHSSLASLSRRYGPIMYLKFGTRDVVVASTASAAATFLKKHDLQFANRPALISAQLVAYECQNLVFQNYGPNWKLTRKLSSMHFLGTSALARWAHVRSSEMDRLVLNLCHLAEEGKPVKLLDAVVCTMANIIGQVTISKRVFDNKQGKVFREMISELMEVGGSFNIGEFIPAIAWLDLQGVQRKLKMLHVKFNDMMTRMIKEHEETREERRGNLDFLDHIMEYKNNEKDGEMLSDVNVKGLIFDMFTAGADTTSIVIEWAMTEMLNNPAIMRRTQSEMDQVIGKTRKLQESDLPNLPYLQAISKEALRLHPSTPLNLPHFTFKECYDVDGYYIPKNTRLLINIWAIGRDPNVWKDPLDFKPERFLDAGEMSDLELIPFGAGRRVCVGKQLGILMLQYILGILLQSFDWKLPDGHDKLNMDEAFGLALPKAEQVIAFAKPRLNSNAYMA